MEIFGLSGKTIEGSKRVKKRHFDTRHGVRSASPLPSDTEVWVTTGQQKVEGQVIAPAGTPRSYIVSTPQGRLWRNRHHLITRPRSSQVTESFPNGDDSMAENPEDSPVSTDSPGPPRSPIMTQSRTNTVVRPPDRFIPGGEM